MSRRRVWGLVVGALCLFASLQDASAQSAPAPSSPSQGTQTQNGTVPAVPSPWSFSASPYLWFAGLDGKIGINQNLPSVDVDISFSEIFKSIDWMPPPVMFVGEVRYDRFAAFTDFIFLGLEDENSHTRGPLSATVDSKLDTIIWTLGGSYRFIDNKYGFAALLAGARLWNVDATGTLVGPFAVRQRSGGKTWVDPIVGLNGRINLGGGFALQAEGDVGSGAARVDWQLMGTLQYQLADWVTLAAGYRYLAVDYESGNFRFDAALHGPIIGATFRF